MKVFDVLQEKFIDEKDKELIAPPERYHEVVDDDFHLETVAIYSDDIFVGTGMLDRKRQLLFSGYVTCERAKERGCEWVTAKEDE